MTKNRIFGLIGVVWGGGIVLSRLARGSAEAAAVDPAYASGQTTAFAFGVIMLIVGLYYLIKG